MKIDKRFFLSALLSVGLAFGMTACGGDDSDDGDNQENQGGENNGNNENNGGGTETLCGNGTIDTDAEEICDIGADGQRNTSDDKMGNDLTCEMYAASSSADKDKTGWEGKPGCSSDCKGLSKGTCVSAEERDSKDSEGVNGILKCSSTLAVSTENKSATAKVSYEMGSTTPDSGVKSAIVCSSATGTVEADVSVASLTDAASGSAELSLDLSNKSAGEYACYVIVKAGSQGSVICPLEKDTPVKASGSIATIDPDGNFTVPYTVVAAEDVKASFTNFDIDGLKDLIVSDGVSATGDSNVNLKLHILDGTSFNKISKGANAAGDIHALIIGGGTGWATEKKLTTTENSYLELSLVSGISSISIKATTGTGEEDSGHMFILDDAGNEIISDFHAKKGEWKTEKANIASTVTKLYIYAYEMGNGNLIIDNITLY